MHYDDGIEEITQTTEYKALRDLARARYQGNASTACAEFRAAYSVALKMRDHDRVTMETVQALESVLTEYTGTDAEAQRRLLARLVRHALRPTQSFQVVTMVCPPRTGSGAPDDVVFTSAYIPETGSIWDNVGNRDTAERWADVSPIVAQHLETYHGHCPIDTDPLREWIDAARHRIYRTTTGATNTWIEYTDDTGQDWLARVSIRRVGQDNQEL